MGPFVHYPRLSNLNSMAKVLILISFLILTYTWEYYTLPQNRKCPFDGVTSSCLKSWNSLEGIINMKIMNLQILRMAKMTTDNKRTWEY